MKKRILALAMSCLMTFAMVGCNKTASTSEPNRKERT